MWKWGIDRAWTPALTGLAVLAFGALAFGCGGGESVAGGDSDLSGAIRIEGSGFIAPLTEALALDFEASNPGVTVAVGGTGTGPGFIALCEGDIDIADAAWTIEPLARKLCRESRVAYRGIPVAAQAVVLLVNEQNPVDCLTTRQLEDIWDPKSTISSWEEIDGLEEKFHEKLVLYGLPTDSFTFEYFSEATDGVAGGNRRDYKVAGEEGDVMVDGLASASGTMGYLNFFSYVDNESDNIKAVEVDDGKGCVAPSAETARDGSYSLLSRKMLLYVNRSSLKKPAVKAFVDYYRENIADLAESFRLVPLSG